MSMEQQENQIAETTAWLHVKPIDQSDEEVVITVAINDEKKKKHIQEKTRQLDEKSAMVTKLEEDLSLRDKEIIELQDQVRELTRQVDEKSARVTKLEEDLSLRDNEIIELQDQVRELTRQVDEKSARITKLEEDLSLQKVIISWDHFTMADRKQPPSKKMKTTDNEEVLFDEFCDPDHPKTILFEDVSAAAVKTKDVILRTPCAKSKMSNLFGMELYFKKEFLQYTGSFKERGARYTLLMLSAEQKSKGVITASAGNHALALAFHGQSLGIPVTVVMPTIAPIMKIQACKTYGATIVIHGDNICESRKKAMSLGKAKGMIYINGYDHPHILAGQGTMGLEIVDQVPDLDACIIPVGGGGLIAGTALAIKTLKPDVKIYGVESERCPSFSEALKAGKPVWTNASSSIADGLAVPLVGVNAFATARALIEDMRVVKEEYIALSILRLLELEKAVVEGAGAVGLAAVIQGLFPELKNKKVVVALCGGNIDTTALGRVIERGLAVDRRLIKFVVTVSDRPAGIAQLTTLVSSLGVSIHDIFHERAWLKNDVFAAEVKCVVETRDENHAQELQQVLRANYEHLLWGPTEF